ncbi:MAG: porin [Schleiferiaceae bacterium]
MVLRTFFFFLLFTLSLVAFGQEKSLPELGHGITNVVAKDSSYSSIVTASMQGRYHLLNEAGNLEHSFLIRRARLYFDGFVYQPNITYKFELAFSNHDIRGSSYYTGNQPQIIYDALLMWEFAKGWKLFAGQGKLPGNAERVFSASNMQLIDRSLLNAHYNIDRDLGFQLHQSNTVPVGGILRTKWALTQGEGRNIVVGNLGGLQYTGRLEYLPFGRFTGGSAFSGSDLQREPTPKLIVGYTYNFNDDAVRDRNTLGNFMELGNGALHTSDISTQFLDLIFKYQGASVLLEYAHRTASNPEIIDVNGTVQGYVYTGSAINAAGGLMVSEKNEIALRYTRVSEQSDQLHLLEQYTIGFNRFLVGHSFKIQTDLNYTLNALDAPHWELRSGFELHF